MVQPVQRLSRACQYEQIWQRQHLCAFPNANANPVRRLCQEEQGISSNTDNSSALRCSRVTTIDASVRIFAGLCRK